MSDWFQWAIVAFIVLSILWHVFRGGAANPVSTGTLGRKVNGLTENVAALKTRVDDVEARVKELKEQIATTEDVKDLEQLIDQKFETMRVRIDGQREVSEATGRNVQRIYDIMLEKGLGAR